MILEITQLIWLQTPKGQGITKFIIDYGSEADPQWVCFIHETKEVWTFSNFDVRVCDNVTLGRKQIRSIRDIIQDSLKDNEH